MMAEELNFDEVTIRAILTEDLGKQKVYKTCATFLD
jgi:hypothetical protein